MKFKIILENGIEFNDFDESLSEMVFVIDDVRYIMTLKEVPNQD